MAQFCKALPRNTGGFSPFLQTYVCVTDTHFIYHPTLALCSVIQYYKSRSEQAPGSEFHPRDKSEKNDFGFLGPSWCNKKVNPETYVPCGSYELM